MGMVLPIASLNEDKVIENFLGSATVLKQKGNSLLLVTCAHLLNNQLNPIIIYPPHSGILSNLQSYPQAAFKFSPVEVLDINPLLDLVFLKLNGIEGLITLPSLLDDFQKIEVGESVVVLSYPFAPLGSVLETFHPCFVSAKGLRIISPELGVKELILTYHAHTGSSGGGVYSQKDGKLCGIVRGALAISDTLRIGNIPVGTDSSVTFAISTEEFIKDVTYYINQF